MRRIIARLLPLLLLCHFFAVSAEAQQRNRPPNLTSGDAVVTGFSETIIVDPAKPRPANKSAVDLTFINPDGPTARVVGVGRPGYVWDGRLLQAPKTFDVLARDTGQVFGVALDDQPAPNIYLAATSVFGLNLVGRGADGSPERRKTGGPGAGWMKGQFGLDLQGDPGSIYKVDGTTGTVTLFAKVMLDGVPNPGPALGNLAYDAAHKQLFVSDLYTGMIHRFTTADGSEPGTPYDHGVTGRGAANLPPMPFNPANRPNIANNKFNAENPDSWAFAPPERRVWGLAVQAGRLFYSARNGAAAEAPQIWSVGIAQDGSFGTDARLEVEAGAQPGPYPVSDIAFSQKGAMILAQRAPIAASYDYSAFTTPGEPRVLRYWLKDANDPPSLGLWKPMPEEYAVGFAGTYRNTDGGVALGYGYGPDGTLSGAACEGALWTTGQNLRNNPALRSQLAPGGPLVVNGLQGSPSDMVRSANEPPAISYFVDYDDKFDDPRARGHTGSVRVLAQPCATPVAAAGSSSASSPPYVSGPHSGPTPTPTPAPFDLAITKTVGDVKFDEKTGTWTFTFALTVTNAGAPFSPGGFINISDPIPAGLTVTSATGTGWSPCTGNLQCGYNFGSGIFNTGATLPPLLITVTTKTPGTYENCATVGMPSSSGFHETKLSNNKDCKKVEVNYPPSNVTIVKTGPAEGGCIAGAPCTFSFTVTNNSPWPFNGQISVADDAGIPMTVSATTLPCNPPPTAIPFLCMAQLSMPAGPSSQSFTVTAWYPVGTIPPVQPPETFQNCVSMSQAPPVTGFPSTISANGKDCKPYVACGFQCHMKQTQIDEVKIEKKANSTQCSPGGLCSYTFTISNLSTTAPTSYFPIAFLDTMPAGSTFMPPPVPSPWSCIPFGGPGEIKCLYPPSTIPAGGQLTVTVTFQIPPNYSSPTLSNCSEFFIGQGAMAAVQRRSEITTDTAVLRAYLQSRGISASSAKSTPPVLQPDDKSCTTVDIVTSAGLKSCPPGSIQKGKECVAPPPPVCQPPMVPGAIPGQCICPQGTVLRGKECVKQEACALPLVTGPVAGQCVCPQGTVQQGKRCVPPLECRSPLVPNAAGTDCVCRPGLVQKGRRCVEPTVCNPPAKLNRRGACECPTDMVAKGNSCVERERRPQISPGDIIRNVPGGRDNPRGGRDNDNPRSGRDTDGPRGGGQGPIDFPGRR